MPLLAGLARSIAKHVLAVVFAMRR